MGPLGTIKGSFAALTDVAESERGLRASATDRGEFSCARDEGMNWVVLSVFILILISGATPTLVNVMVSSTERPDAALASLVSSSLKQGPCHDRLCSKDGW